jgi:hypothetical protein
MYLGSVPTTCKLFRELYVEYCKKHDYQERILFFERLLFFEAGLISSISILSLKLQNPHRPGKFFPNIDVSVKKSISKPDADF